MKKTHFGKKTAYSVAMSEATGCVVNLKIEADQSLTVLGSIDREQSLNLAKGILAWVAPKAIEEAVEKATKPKLSLVP